MYQFKAFTEKANKALNLAIESAEEMRHNYVGTEHILYGLVKEGSGVAATALNECGVSEDASRIKEGCSEKIKREKRVYFLWLQKSFSLELDKIYKNQTKLLFFSIRFKFCPQGQN